MNGPGGNPPGGINKIVVTTVAGEGIAAFRDGPALTSRFRAPQDVAVTADGILYVADALNHRIRKIAGGLVTTLAGFDREDTISGLGTAAGFALPYQITADATGNLYTLDVHDYRVRKITPAGLVTVVAGNGFRGFADGEVDMAKFGESIGIVTDDQGNIYVSDLENYRIRKIDNTGQVRTIAGNGISGYINGNGDEAEFQIPSGIVVDKHGNLFVGDFTRIRKISPDGIVSTFTGQNATGFRDGDAGVALFTMIDDLVIDGQENIYVTDNNRIRKISAQGEVTTIVGGEVGYQNGDAVTAKFNGAHGLGIDKAGNIYVADVNNNRIREISFH